MFEYLHPEMEWHMPVYGMDMGDIEDVKEAIRGYQSEFNNMKFTADYWLPGVNTETGIPDGSTRVYGTWTSTHASTGKETSLTTYHSFEFNEGKIFEQGPPEKLFDDPQNERTKQFLHAVLDAN